MRCTACSSMGWCVVSAQPVRTYVTLQDGVERGLQHAAGLLQCEAAVFSLHVEPSH